MTQPIPDGTECRYLHPDDLVVQLWGSDIVRVMEPHPMLPGMVKVIGKSGDTDYVQWGSLEPLTESEKKVTYECVSIGSRVGLMIPSDRSHAIIERTGGAKIHLDKESIKRLLDVISDRFVLDLLG